MTLLRFDAVFTSLIKGSTVFGSRKSKHTAGMGSKNVERKKNVVCQHCDRKVSVHVLKQTSNVPKRHLTIVANSARDQFTLHESHILSTNKACCFNTQHYLALTRGL